MIRVATSSGFTSARISPATMPLATVWVIRPRHCSSTFVTRARNEIAALIRARQWRSSFLGRVKALVGGQRDLNVLVARLRREARAEGIPERQVKETLRLARAAHRTATAAAHYEDLRAVLASWRYLHRWIAVALVLLVGLHVAYSLTYGALFDGGGG